VGFWGDNGYSWVTINLPHGANGNKRGGHFYPEVFPFVWYCEEWDQQGVAPKGFKLLWGGEHKKFCTTPFRAFFGPPYYGGGEREPHIYSGGEGAPKQRDRMSNIYTTHKGRNRGEKRLH